MVTLVISCPILVFEYERQTIKTMKEKKKITQVIRPLPVCFEQAVLTHSTFNSTCCGISVWLCCRWMDYVNMTMILIQLIAYQNLILFKPQYCIYHKGSFTWNVNRECNLKHWGIIACNTNVIHHHWPDCFEYSTVKYNFFYNSVVLFRLQLQQFKTEAGSEAESIIFCFWQ